MPYSRHSAHFQQFSSRHENIISSVTHNSSKSVNNCGFNTAYLSISSAQPFRLIRQGSWAFFPSDYPGLSLAAARQPARQPPEAPVPRRGPEEPQCARVTRSRPSSLLPGPGGERPGPGAGFCGRAGLPALTPSPEERPPRPLMVASPP